MTSIYVARSLGVDTSIMNGGASVGTIVGGDTALDTRDGDTSYIRVTRYGNLDPGAPEHTQMPFRWEKLSGPTPNPASVTSITVAAEFRKDPAATQLTVAAGTSTIYEGDPVNVISPWFTSTTDWTYVESSLDPFYAGIVTAGDPFLIYPFEPGLTTAIAFRLTYLVAILEGAPFLRQRNRDTSRARNRASRQRGIRQRGYL